MNPPEDQSTRRNVLHLLKTRGPLSVGDIKTEMGITDMAVRRHLGSLQRDGLIETRTARQTTGRPTALYRLTETAEELFPKNYHTLALDLLNELVEEAGSDLVDVLFERRKKSLEQKYGGTVSARTLEEKVARLARLQNDNGYMAKWEAVGKAEEAYELTEHNCPISQVANRFEQACRCELELFESLLDADVERTTCLAKGGTKCVYRIRPKTAPQREA